MKPAMIEKPVDVTNRRGLLLPGLMSFIVGLMFFIPGIYFTYTISIKSLLTKDLPGIPAILFISFITIMGTILLLLSYQFFSGKVGRQHISTPILIFASAFFILIATYIALLVFVFKTMQPGTQASRAIGGGFAIGGLGLWFAYKRRSGISKKQINNRDSAR